MENLKIVKVRLFTYDESHYKYLVYVGSGPIPSTDEFRALVSSMCAGILAKESEGVRKMYANTRVREAYYDKYEELLLDDRLDNSDMSRKLVQDYLRSLGVDLGGSISDLAYKLFCDPCADSRMLLIEEALDSIGRLPEWRCVEFDSSISFYATDLDNDPTDCNRWHLDKKVCNDI